MYSRKEKAMEGIGWSSILKENNERKMTDSDVSVRVNNTTNGKVLDKKIPREEDQDRCDEGNKKEEELPSTCAVKSEEPSASLFCEKKHFNQLTNEDTSEDTNNILTPTALFKNTDPKTTSISTKTTDIKSHDLQKVKTKINNDTTTEPKVAEANFEPNAHLRLSTLPPKPVQIIDIAAAGSSNTGRDRLIFQDLALKEILSQVSRKPVALLSIAGPSRTGKSFLLSYMLKYLQSNSVSAQNPTLDADCTATSPTSDADCTATSTTSDADWMGISKAKRDTPLSEGFSWSYGSKRETVGIWMWPQPFSLKTTAGFEFDVLLVDTQGVFDPQTDQKDWATIVGLSLLTSSCLIFNNMWSLDENSLITLKEFMDFGLMATQTGDQNTDKGNNEDGKSTTRDLSVIPPKQAKPFQKLTFLIRDWRFPDELPFGVAGGASYLQRMLDQKDTEAGEERRHQIKLCFDQLDCFLMPEPGEKVKRKNFGGSVAEMDFTFAENIKIFIEHLFDPSEFPPKYISGNLVTGDDLYYHFEQYVRIFNSDQMPSPQDLNGATAIICNRTIVNKCLEIYEKSLRNNLAKMNRNFALEHELQKSHKIAQDSASKLFQESRKMGTNTEVSKVQADLKQLSHAFLKGAETENLKKRIETVLAATENLQQYYNNLIDIDIRKTYQGHGADKFVMPDMFKRIAKNCRSATQSHLLEILSLESFDLLSTDEKRRFESATVSGEARQELINQTNFTNAEKKLRKIVQKTTRDYKSYMNEAIQKSKYWSAKHLKDTDSSVSREVFQKFELRYSTSFLFQQGKDQLIDGIRKQLENIQETIEIRNQNFLLTLGKLVMDLVKMYMDEMEEAAASKKSLADTHEKATANCIRRLEKSDGFNRIPPESSQEYLSDLCTNISATYSDLIEKWLPRKQQELLKKYKGKMSRIFKHSSYVFTVDELQEKQILNKKKVVKELETFLWKIPLCDKSTARLTRNSKSIFENFDQEIEAFMKSILKKNAKRKIALQEDITGYLVSAKYFFDGQNKEINKFCRNGSKHDTLLTKAKDSARIFFRGKCAEIGRRIPLEKYDQELENYFNKAPIFKKSIDGRSLLISGPGLKFSRELRTLENMKTSIPDSIREIHWISSGEVVLDENVCGEFWEGKNLVICSKKVQVIGNERIIYVSGRNGRAANNSDLNPPPTPRDVGKNGQNGEDGEAGESGGNVAIVTESIENAHNLKITSNGGAGGNGQCGGYGSNGKSGIDGDQRCSMSMEELEELFPSPAKFENKQCTNGLTKGENSLKNLAKSGNTVEKLRVLNDSSRCSLVKTNRGAVIRYAFYQDHLKGYKGGRSFYVWFQGAPGTSGQPGGIGGFGGRGGSPGNPGDVTIIPAEFERHIDIQRKTGMAGITGKWGEDGLNGSNGKQGTDYAIIDPYAGIWYPMANKYPVVKTSGNLRMYIKGEGLVTAEYSVEMLTSGALPTDPEGIVFEKREAAYCPHFEKYISFIQTSVLRETLQVERAVLVDETGATRESESKRPINIQEFVAKLGVFSSRLHQ